MRFYGSLDVEKGSHLSPDYLLCKIRKPPSIFIDDATSVSSYYPVTS